MQSLIEARIHTLFSTIDSKDSAGFVGFLTENCSFRFGNLEPVCGSENIRNFVAAFFDSIQGLQHQITDVWRTDNSLGCHGMVTYTRHDQSLLRVPFAVILREIDGLFSEYLIFSDASSL